MGTFGRKAEPDPQSKSALFKTATRVKNRKIETLWKSRKQAAAHTRGGMLYIFWDILDTIL